MWDFLLKISLKRGLTLVILLFGNVLAPLTLLLSLGVYKFPVVEIKAALLLSFLISIPLTLYFFFVANLDYNKKAIEEEYKVKLKETDRLPVCMCEASLFTASTLYFMAAARGAHFLADKILVMFYSAYPIRPMPLYATIIFGVMWVVFVTAIKYIDKSK